MVKYRLGEVVVEISDGADRVLEASPIGEAERWEFINLVCGRTGFSRKQVAQYMNALAKKGLLLERFAAGGFPMRCSVAPGWERLGPQP